MSTETNHALQAISGAILFSLLARHLLDGPGYLVGYAFELVIYVALVVAIERRSREPDAIYADPRGRFVVSTLAYCFAALSLLQIFIYTL